MLTLIALTLSQLQSRFWQRNDLNSIFSHQFGIWELLDSSGRAARSHLMFVSVVFYV